MKRPYEITVVIRILANEEETQNAIEQIRGWMQQPNTQGEAQGLVTRVDRTSLGRRKLAYEIDKQRDGIFVIFMADIEPAHMSELELNLKLSQSVLRHLVVRLDESVPAEPEAVAAVPVVQEAAVAETSVEAAAEATATTEETVTEPTIPAESGEPTTESVAE